MIEEQEEALAQEDESFGEEDESFGEEDESFGEDRYMEEENVADEMESEVEIDDCGK